MGSSVLNSCASTHSHIYIKILSLKIIIMAIKMKSPPRPIKAEADEENLNPEEVVTNQPPVDPLRGVRASGGGINKAKSTEVEFSRLKTLVPSISKKQAVSKLDVILEAIRYIDELQDQLLEQIQDRRLHPAAAAELLMGKENTHQRLLIKKELSGSKTDSKNNEDNVKSSEPK